jgi:hypothetical protein
VISAGVSTLERELLCDGDYHAFDSVSPFDPTRALVAIDVATNNLVWA